MDNFQKKIVSRALDDLDMLSEWEIEFILSISELEDSPLTDKQKSVLNRILQKLDQ